MVLPWVEKALIAAEPLALAHVIAESLDTKAGMMADQGRLQEALALMRGAVRYAEAHGQFEAEMRARNNLLFIDIDDPASSLEVVLEGLETGKRIGLLDWERQLAAVSMGVLGCSRGDFERCLAYAPLFEGEEVPLAYRFGFMGVRAAASALRGDIDAARAILAQADERLKELSDPQNGFQQAFNTPCIDTLSGRPETAVTGLLALTPGMTGTWLGNCLPLGRHLCGPGG